MIRRGMEHLVGVGTAVTDRRVKSCAALAGRVDVGNRRRAVGPAVHTSEIEVVTASVSLIPAPCRNLKSYLEICFR